MSVWQTQTWRKLLLAILISSAAGLACANRSSDQDALTELVPTLLIANTQPVLVIGDSLTDFSSGFALQSRLGPQYSVAFRGIINTDFNFWTGRLDETFAQSTAGPPVHILVPLGTNDAFTLTPAQFIDRVTGFHRELRKQSQARTYYFLMPETLIASLAPAIAANNTELRARFAELFAGDDSVLIDLDTVFKNASPVPALYSLEDPLHPTDSGYELMSIEMERAIRR